MTTQRFRFFTAGESHGQGLTAIIEGVPAGLNLSESDIATDLARRQHGHGRGGRMKIEKDQAKITAGVRHGKTLGSPISLWIMNRDWENWTDRMSITPVEEEIERVTRVRPGHADLPGSLKYRFDDVRNVLERASARETAARVAVAGIAKRLLDEFGVSFQSHTISLGNVHAKIPKSVNDVDWNALQSDPVRCADKEASQQMVDAIDAAKKDGDTLGGEVEVRVSNVPIGWGSYVQWDRRLDGRIAQAICSINAFKGVGFGLGFGATTKRGSETHDVIQAIETWDERLWPHETNRHGGIEGGISTGEEIIVRAAVKPIPTLATPLPSVDLETGEEVLAHYERSDVCVVPAAGVVAEAMVAIILADAWIEKFGGDTIEEIRNNFKNSQKSLKPRKA